MNETFEITKKPDPRIEARKKSQDMDKRLLVTDRVIQLRLIRPYDERIEKDFREFKKSLKEELKKMGSAEKKASLRKKKISEFFESKKKQFPDMVTFREMLDSMRFSMQFLRDIYNRAISKSYLQLIQKQKIDHYGNVKSASSESRGIPYHSARFKNTRLPSDLVVGMSKKISSNFRPREILQGKISLPSKRSGTLPFYRSQGAEQETDSLIEFSKSPYPNDSFDDFVLKMKMPVMKNGEILFGEMKVLCSTAKRQRNFRRNVDDAANKTIMEFLDGTRNNVVENFLGKKVEEGILLGDELEKLIRKYTNIASYELLFKPTKFSQKLEPYVSITIKDMGEKQKLNNNLVAGIDFCFSKEKILSLAIIDVAKRKECPEDIGKWQILGKHFLDGRDTNRGYKPEYGLRRVYDNWYSEARLWQKRVSKKIDMDDESIDFVRRFRNRRTYISKLIVSNIAEILIDKGVSRVHIENLDTMSKREDWFTVNKIRNFPRKELMNMLSQKLALKGVLLDAKGVNPKNTSQTCSICGLRNENFDFSYRSKENFPPFTCKGDGCRFNRPLSVFTGYEKYVRDADLNAARNIALRGEKLI
ncbi:MAG: hypothetical protein HY051_02360 [Candidatus Aenigmarchaeota archaeon]|nr:hypothetical protein [Candidatus Aenigmarchaeota archaeon]